MKLAILKAFKYSKEFLFSVENKIVIIFPSIKLFDTNWFCPSERRDIQIGFEAID